MHYSELTSVNMPKNYFIALAITKDLLSNFDICKPGLVQQTKYYRNIQTLISKSDFSMSQHDLETHNSITTRPL